MLIRAERAKIQFQNERIRICLRDYEFARDSRGTHTLLCNETIFFQTAESEQGNASDICRDDSLFRKGAPACVPGSIGHIYVWEFDAHFQKMVFRPEGTDLRLAEGAFLWIHPFMGQLAA